VPAADREYDEKYVVESKKRSSHVFIAIRKIRTKEYEGKKTEMEPEGPEDHEEGSENQCDIDSRDREESRFG
jgi:hypothetical protein